MTVIMFPKPKRKKDPELLHAVRHQFCAACGDYPCDPHHVTTRGAGGNDEPDNVMPLCHLHHVEIHSLGISHMLMRYPRLAGWLKAKGRDDVFERLDRIV